MRGIHNSHGVPAKYTVCAGSMESRSSAFLDVRGRGADQRANNTRNLSRDFPAVGDTPSPTSTRQGKNLGIPGPR